VIGDGGVFVVAALVDSDACPFGNISTVRLVRRTSTSARAKRWHAVEVLVDLNMVIDADPADAPLGKTRLCEIQLFDFRWLKQPATSLILA
jgi:hypothetical protein